jgi:hypothetical protein
MNGLVGLSLIPADAAESKRSVERESRFHRLLQMTTAERSTLAAQEKNEYKQNDSGDGSVLKKQERESSESEGFVPEKMAKVPTHDKAPPNKNQRAKQNNDVPPHQQVCRVVALPDGKLPTAASDLPPEILESPHLLDKLDAIYHAMSHEETRRLRYLERSKNIEPVIDETEEENLVLLLRNSLEDAGFELLTRRDVDLCEALNAGYLLRLSIAPDVAGFDPTISKEFYPEYYDEDGKPNEDLLFEGRVLLYRRGYSSEVTEGKLLLPKLDYLQASIVQRSARRVTEAIGRVERQLLSTVTAVTRHFQIVARNQLARVADTVPNPSVARFLRIKWGWKPVDKETLDHDKEDMASIGFFKFSRYGGESRNRFLGSPGTLDALDPFLCCDIADIDTVDGEPFHEVNGALNSSAFTCLYDSQQSHPRPSSSYQEDVLLERVSINNVVDLSTSQGRRNVVKRFFAKSKLVEPTFEEVVAIWRPLPDKPNKKLLPPKFIYSVAEIFEVEDKLPEFEEPEPDPLPPPLEIRSFDSVPMANAPAVLPKTKLLFRPADAFLFDFITVFSAAAVIGSQRFDNPRLDLLAIVSGTLWIIRTIIRYSNKLARYDLLVKKFLTSKISHRNGGALKYITREAANQRATRAALVYVWLVDQMKRNVGRPIARRKLVQEGSLGVNKILQADGGDSYRYVRVDIDAALNDLADLNLIEFDSSGERLIYVASDEETVVTTLRTRWNLVFQDEMVLNRLVGRRRRERTSE